MVVLGNCSCIALSPESIQSLVEINNVGDDPLSSCPEGAKLEKQFSVAALDKVPTRMWDTRVMQEQLPRITIIFVLRLDLIS
jgi:hypothetical protein